MNITLTVIDGPQKGKKFEFHEPDNFLLGRDNAGSNAHFRLNNDDTQVSRNHFLLEINPPDCFIRDAGSLNGTFIALPGVKQVWRKDDKKEYESRGAKLKEQLGYSSLDCAEVRLKLADKDVIHVGQTAILVEIIAQARPQSAQQAADSDSHCIECGASMTNPASMKRADLLCVDDFICHACKEKHDKARRPVRGVSCCDCACDVTSQSSIGCLCHGDCIL